MNLNQKVYDRGSNNIILKRIIMIEVNKFRKLSNDGYKQPMNDPNESTPDNITTHSCVIISQVSVM